MMVVNNHTALSNASRAIERAHEAGIQWIRIGLAYAVIEPQKGSFQWSTYDTLVEKARSEQLQIVATLAYATQWNTTAPASELRAAQREHYPPASLDEWASYVRSTVTRYRSVIHHWEVWNEPDLGGTAVPCNGFWCGTAAQYAQLLHVTYDAIKEADPAASVLLGGLSLSTADGYRFGSEILNDRQYPAARSFDIMNVHVYGSQQEAMRRMSGIQAALAAAGVPNRPIWITELGLLERSREAERGGVFGRRGRTSRVSPRFHPHAASSRRAEGVLVPVDRRRSDHRANGPAILRVRPPEERHQHQAGVRRI